MSLEKLVEKNNIDTNSRENLGRSKRQRKPRILFNF